MRAHRVDHLLMGGQACVLYGAAESSRDVDLAVLPDPDNLDRLRAALADLDAEVIAVPPFSQEFLEAGLAVHFRCRHPEARGLRIDVMTRLRGVEPFPRLWKRRTNLAFGDEVLDVLSLPDLVAAKKSQRDKDWPMGRRLVDINYLDHREQPTAERVAFWLRELRSPELLVEAARAHPEEVARAHRDRPLLDRATPEHLDYGTLARALRTEEEILRSEDEAYWRPLRRDRSIAQLIRDAMARYRETELEPRRPLRSVPVLPGHRPVGRLPATSSCCGSPESGTSRAASMP